MRALAFALLLAAAGPGLGCAGAPMRVASLDEVERVRVTETSKEAGARAPEVYARAEREREFARAAHAAGDDVAANLHAERAIAAYGHAGAVARLSGAIAELADAQKALDDATAQEQALAASRAKLELDALDLERRAQVARERLLPASSGEASADREAARLAAARALATEARLLCGAAQLVLAGASGPAGATAAAGPVSLERARAAADAGAVVGPIAGAASGDTLSDAQGEVDKLDARLARPSSAPPSPVAPGSGGRSALIDDAGTVRARCLDALTRARREAGRDEDRADALLAELSASGGWDPTRDERGIVVTLRGIFQGPKLTDDGEAKLEGLGRVAAAHPGFGLQLVVHDAQPPSPKDDGDARHADAAVKALVAGGAPAARVKAELAGARAPAVDPGDARLRARNERVDVVFVSGG